jgi:hypothetical protein
MLLPCGKGFNHLHAVARLAWLDAWAGELTAGIVNKVEKTAATVTLRESFCMVPLHSALPFSQARGIIRGLKAVKRDLASWKGAQLAPVSASELLKAHANQKRFGKWGASMCRWTISDSPDPLGRSCLRSGR